MRFLKPEEWNDFSSIPHLTWNASGNLADAEEIADMKRQLAEAIQELPERERIVLTLYYSEELKLKEIGEVIEVSESRVSRILASAKFRLKELVHAKA
jgi:RNA polymerase sigma factor for flagellar operon FliA